MDSCVLFLPQRDSETEASVEPSALPACFEKLLERVEPLFDEVLLSVVAGSALHHCPVPVLMSPPRTGGRLAALYSAIQACEGNPIFALSADRPLIHVDLVHHMRRLAEDFDVVIPRHGGRYDPLCAFYTRRCLRPMEGALDLVNRRVASFFEQIRLRCLDADEIQRFDPHLGSLKPIESEADYRKALKRSQARAATSKKRRRKTSRKTARRK